MSALDYELKQRVLAAVAAEPVRARPAAARVRWLVLLGASAVSIAAFIGAGGVRPSGRPLELIAATSIGALAIAAAAAALAFRRGRSMLGRSAPVLAATVLATPIVLLAWKLGVSAIFPEMTRWWPERPGLRCLRLATTMGIAPTVAVLYLWRGTAPAYPRLTGLALGVAVGALAWVMVDAWCPVAHVHHLLLGHVLPMALLGAVGALAGGVIGVRRAPAAQRI
jgi:hypothetical protein